MTVAYEPDELRRTETHHLRVPGWDVCLAAVGDASARLLHRVRPATIRMSEGGRMGSAPSIPFVRHPLVEARLSADGTVRVRCHQAPPALLIHLGVEPVRPLTEGDAILAPNSLLFACSPSLLDALEPAEVVAAPTLLWLSPDPASLLRRWTLAAERQGLDGAAAMVARRDAAVRLDVSA